MANFARLNEEEIKIEVDHKNRSTSDNLINIILRNPKREDYKMIVNTKNIKTIKNLRKEFSLGLKIKNENLIKMFFKGRPLKDESSFSEFNFTNNDVILYMVAEPELSPEENEISVLTQNLEIDPNENEIIGEAGVGLGVGGNFLNRGFNRFLQQGLSNEEIHVLRILFHTAFFARNRSGDGIDWSPEAIFTREEAWLNSNNETIPVRMYVRQINNSGVNRRFDFSNTRRMLFNDQMLLNELDSEPNIRIFYGFLLGIILNIYTVIFLLFCNFTRKFKFGLQLGMIFGVFLLLLYNMY